MVYTQNKRLQLIEELQEAAHRGQQDGFAFVRFSFPFLIFIFTFSQGRQSYKGREGGSERTGK